MEDSASLEYTILEDKSRGTEEIVLIQISK